MVQVLSTAAYFFAVLPFAFNAPYTRSQGKLPLGKFLDSSPDHVTKPGSKIDHSLPEVTESCEDSPDLARALRSQARRKRYSLKGSKWHKSHLEYKILSYPEGLLETLVRQEIQKAFDAWSRYANLEFTLVTDDNESDIKIEFVDDEDFDGPEGVLARTSYPQYGGKVRFDKSETWTVGDPEGKDLFQVAVHEIGHALGLRHSHDISSVMWPCYTGYIENMQLSEDDIRAIQALYGPKTNEERILCDGEGVDAVFSTPDGTYIFKGLHYWLLHEKESSKPQAKLIMNTWKELPGDIDAAFTDKKGRVYFFKGSHYWRYRGNRLDGKYPRKISTAFPGIPDDIDAVFTDFKGKLYFFKGKYYYKFLLSKKTSIHPRLIEKRWSGMPNKIDAAIKKKDGPVYFFSGNYNYVFSDEGDVNEMSDPASLQFKGRWFGCKDARSSQM